MYWPQPKGMCFEFSIPSPTPSSLECEGKIFMTFASASIVYNHHFLEIYGPFTDGSIPSEEWFSRKTIWPLWTVRTVIDLIFLRTVVILRAKGMNFLRLIRSPVKWSFLRAFKSSVYRQSKRGMIIILCQSTSRGEPACLFNLVLEISITAQIMAPKNNSVAYY